MNERDMSEAEPVLRAGLEAIGAKRWMELAGVRLAWGRGGAWVALGERFVPAPLSVEALNEALRGSRAELDSEASVEEVMEFVELATGMRVIRTKEALHSFTLDQPGPEVIHSGTIGARGQSRWEAPRRTEDGMVFYANVWREGGADFVRLQVTRASRSISLEVIDDGWFEIAAYLG